MHNTLATAVDAAHEVSRSDFAQHPPPSTRRPGGRRRDRTPTYPTPASPVASHDGPGQARTASGTSPRDEWSLSRCALTVSAATVRSPSPETRVAQVPQQRRARDILDLSGGVAKKLGPAGRAAWR